jgi:ATP-dependent protease ClpP protease subunit
MAKELLLYKNISSYSAESFITSLEEVSNDNVVLRINTDGGNPQDGWGMIAKWKEHKGKKHAKVDGKAYSFGAFFLCYTEDAEALDVSEFLLHRASYGTYYEASEYMTQYDWDNLDRINKNLRTALEAKIDVKRFEKLKGVTVDQLFSNSSRVDVRLTAQEALEIGLISKIVPITPEISAQINARVVEISACYIPKPSASSQSTASQIKPNKIMTLDEFKTQHPAIYALAVADGVAKEKDRTGAWLAFVDLDPEAVSKGIKEGKEVTATAMAEFTRKAISAQALAALAKGNPPDVTPGEETPVPQTENQKKVEAFASSVKQLVGLK